MSSEHPTAETRVNHSPLDPTVRADTMSDVVLARLSGGQFQAIGLLFDVDQSFVRYYIKRAIKEGLVTRDQLGMRSSLRPLRFSDEAYRAHWIARVNSRLVTDENGCKLWTGSVATNGYGLSVYRQKSCAVHRKLFEVTNGLKLSQWDYVCHTCDVRLCANLDHLFLGNPVSNAADMVAKGRHAEQLVTHCPRGHAYDETNTYRPPGKPWARQCKICVRSRKQRKAA